MTPTPVAIAQTNPVLGDLGKNLTACAALVEKAAADGARIVVFPELAATGYFLKDLVSEVAVRRDDPRLADLLGLSRRIAIVIGVVEESEDHLFYNSAFYMEGGRVAAVHRKVYLPTYGLFDESRFMAGGETIRAFESVLGRAAMLVCEDLWHLSAPLVAAHDGAKVLLCPSASPIRGVPADRLPAPAEVWQAMIRTYASLLGVHVVYANRVGFEDGIGFWGGSEIVAPDGSVLASAPVLQESLIIGEIDERAVRRERITTPLFRDERLDLTVRELSRLLAARAERA